MLPGRPRVVTTRVESFGGIYDCRAQRWHDESANPVVWYLGPEQRDLAVHGDGLPDKLLVRGAEGAGKTRGALAPWGLLRVIEFAGQNLEIGGTAPTQARLETLRLALAERMPTSWYVYRQRDWLFRFHLGVQLRLVSAHRQSEAQGSPVQGYDWAAWLGDEGQDQLDIMDDIEARGRRAPGGRYRRMMTCTAKDSPAYRTFEDRWAKNPLCTVIPLPAFSNPFVAREHWENLRLTLSAREYDRRVLARAVGPERMVYPEWERSENLREVPQIGAMDVTARVLGQWGPRFGLLAGHDPGNLFDVTLLLRFYQLAGRALPSIWVVGELTTEQTTAEQHGLALLDLVRKEHGAHRLDMRGRPLPDGPLMLVHADPYGMAATRPDKEVYTVFRRLGVEIRPAAYAKGGTGPGVVPKDQGIEMVRSLLCNANGERRLFVALKPDGTPAAPRLVEAIEASERDEAGHAETQRKNRKDLSHWTAALRYALWAIEKPRMVGPLSRIEGTT